MEKNKNTEKNILVDVNILTKKFGDLLVLNNISFEVYDHEFLCIVGPTGCGKTTFLNSLTGLYQMTSGEILFDGEPVDLKKHNISYVFQETSIMPWLTVEDNIKFGLKMRRFSKDVVEERAKKYMDLVNLTNFKDYYPNQLSISMQQRVVIARAFATEPRLLLMDEPYGQLDLELRYHLEDELINLWKRTNTTVIFITHNVEEAVYLAERILVLTNKPSTIKEELVVDLPGPRKIADPDFVDIRNKVTDLIKWW